MKKFASVLPAVAILAFAAIAGAGVVVDEQQVIDQPNGNKVTRARTVIIQGDKQKSIIDNGKRTVITDLGKGTMTMVDGTRKTYVEFPFPPRGGAMAAMQGGISPTIRFKKTGSHDKIIGYSCDVPASRKLCEFISAHIACYRCYKSANFVNNQLNFRGFEDFDDWFVKRDISVIRENASEWKKCATEESRKAHVSRHHVRWSEIY